MKNILIFIFTFFCLNVYSQGLNDFTFKRPCRAVATSNVASLSGTTTIDGVSLVANNRVLLTGQSTASQNGLWVVKAGSWVRPVDFNDTYDAKTGIVVVIEEGTVNDNSVWILTTNNPITIGTTNLSWSKMLPVTGGVTSVSAGPGITVSGTTDVTVNATDVSATNEDLANNHQTLAAERNITNNGFDLKVIGSTNGTRFLSSGNVLLGPIANTIGYNNLHIINSGTTAATGVVGRGLTITANNATPPSIYFESPDLTDNSQVMGVQFVSNSGLGLWKLASFNDAGSSATVDNIIAATHAGNVGFGIVPVVKQHIHVPATVTANYTKYSNNTSLATTTDGFNVGINNSNPPIAQLNNLENSNMEFYTNNTSRFVIANGAATFTGQGATTYTSTGTLAITGASANQVNINSSNGGDMNFTGTGTGTDMNFELTGNGSITFKLANQTNSGWRVWKNNNHLLRIGEETSTLKTALLIGDSSPGDEVEGPNVTVSTNTNNMGSWYRNSTTGTFNDGFATYVISGATPTARIHQYENEDIEFYTNNTKRAVFENDGDLGLGVDNPAQKLDVTGNIQLNTAGNKLLIKEGTNASLGVETLVAGTKTVNTTAVTANSRIFVTIQTVGGTPGVLYIGTRVAGTSFDIVSTSGSDTSTVAWWIVEPAP